jgi:urease accessory protein
MTTPKIELNEKATGPFTASRSLTLPFDLRQRSRQRARLDDGEEVGIVLAHGTRLCHGDVLRSREGACVLVRAAIEHVSCARSDDAVRFARACYHLGNRHVPVQVGAGWLRYKNDHVLDDMVRGLGLTVASELAPFEPDGGAYAGHTHGASNPHVAEREEVSNG